jgi:hypothetical protein
VVKGVSAEPSPPTPAQPPVNPLSMSVAEVARLLSAAGGTRVTVEQVQADVDDGAPVLPDGRVNLIHYAAWLVREVQARGD